ncbi:BRCT domain-containing protein [Trypanosoma conorhini]|uniref:BRCT domain-containing protein n=1 Tax=Trypanosoma conorhini TaxID=83891 RepID=A0A422QAK7_9TRYP|nr:BRCT domain-containing protein [Trypanosoma conorhini]RNF26987.1 BRCT domain-containing protein [Trypanosoma conorhini]
MSTLESCTDALLQQKVVQTSNYERLESRLMEMERAKRSLFFGLKEIITDVERRRQDLGELQEESARLQQQLQQGSVKFSALAAFMGEEQKRSIRLQEALESSATAWTGCPARAAFLFRALQERHAFCRQLVDVVTALNRVSALVEVVQRVDAAKGFLQERLERLAAGAERLDGMLRESHKAEETRQAELQGRSSAAGAEVARVWRDSQGKERQLLMLQAALAETRLSSVAGEELNAVYRMALQLALSTADACCAGRERMAVASAYSECLCALGRENLAAVEARTRMLTGVLTDHMAALDAKREDVVVQRERALQETTLLGEKQEALRGAAVAVEHRIQSLQVVRSALRLFRRRQRARRLRLCGERAERKEAVVSARAAHEARVSARRFRALQQEAREGLVAEETLVRGTVEGTEADERRGACAQAAESLLQARATEAAREAEAVKAAAAACVPKSPPEQQQQRQQRRAAVKKDAHDAGAPSTRHTTPNKPANRRIGRANNALSQTDKKRPRSHAASSAAAVARRTYPASTQQQQQQQRYDSDAASDSSANSLGDFLTLGTRVPLSALKSTARRTPLQQLPANIVNQCGTGKQREASRMGLLPDAAVQRVHFNSPLPRPPGSGAAVCALSSALSSAFARAGDAAGGAAGAHSARNNARPRGARPRPSVLVSKDIWGEGKAEDVFADAFSL